MIDFDTYRITPGEMEPEWDRYDDDEVALAEAASPELFPGEDPEGTDLAAVGAAIAAERARHDRRLTDLGVRAARQKRHRDRILAFANTRNDREYHLIVGAYCETIDEEES